MLVFFQRVREGAAISYQTPLQTLSPMLGIKGIPTPTPQLWPLGRPGNKYNSSFILKWGFPPIKWQCSFKSAQWSSLGLASRLNETTDQTFLTGGSGLEIPPTSFSLCPKSS